MRREAYAAQTDHALALVSQPCPVLSQAVSAEPEVTMILAAFVAAIVIISIIRRSAV